MTTKDISSEYVNIDNEIEKYLDGDSSELDFDIDDFNLDILNEESNRIKKPVFNKNPIKVKYNNVKKLVKKIKLFPGEQIHSIVTGDFIFGDFIEGLLVEKIAIAKKMYISTLSLSQNNIDSLHNLITKGYIEDLILMVSNFWYSHERGLLVPYTFKKLDIDNKFQMVVCRNHTKIVLIDIPNIKLIMSGSANLRSSKNDEMFILQESPDLYSFYEDWFNQKIEKYGIINKDIPKTKTKTRSKS